MTNPDKPLLSEASLNLIILTSEGRLDYLAELLSSLGPSYMALFSHCHISVNGSELYLYYVNQLVSRIGMTDGFNIFTTGRYISATHHFKCWTSALSSYLNISSRFLLFADDDLFDSTAETISHFLQMSQAHPHTVSLSRYRHFTDNGRTIPSKLPLEPSSECPPIDLVRQAFCTPFNMNITGMLLPFSVIIDSTNFLFSFASYGRRAELTYITHQRISRVISSSDYLAKVRIHENRESSKRLLVDPAYDELIFILWLWRQRPELRPLRSSDALVTAIAVTFLRSLVHCLRHPLFFTKKILVIFSRLVFGPGRPSSLVSSATLGSF